MKTRLLLLLYGALVCGALFSNKAYSQINYSENFEDFAGDWEGDFFTYDPAACEGTTSFLTNLYVSNTDNEAISPSMGISNGGLVTFSYDYKIMDYPTWPNPPTDATLNADDWGYFEVSYSSSPDGPFTVLETVNTSNHIESTTCATRTVTFTPPAGQSVYIRIYGEIDNTENDFYIFFDNMEATQADPEACMGTPAAVTTVASVMEACTNEPVTLLVNPAYAVSGLSYQWQISTNGTDFEDVEGAESWSYTTTQPVTTWYQVKVTCEAGGDETISTPVEVESNGELCFCEVDYQYDVEPITLVQFAGINNTSGAVVNGTPALEDFTSLDPAEVLIEATYDITLQGNTGGDYINYFKVYIDFNHNGNLNDEGESFEIGTITQSTGVDGDEVTGEITIPIDAMTGLARMRVFKLYAAYSDDPCMENEFGDLYGYGQAEDYLINISAPPQPPVLDYYNLQWPADASIIQGESVTVYAQAWEDGVTPGAGAGEGVMAWIGVSTENTDPATWDDAVWMETTYNTSAESNNDEFMLAIGADLPVGTYYYAARWQLADGPYTYGGYVGAWGEEGVVNGVLTVNCAEIDVPDTEGTMQTFCGEAEAGELDADANVEGGEIVWYDAETDGNMLGAEDELEDGMVYYVAQAVNGCESTRVAITVEITLTPEPDGSSTQVITVEDSSEATIEDLVVDVTGTVNWYDNEDDAEDGENALEAGTVITAGTYYATQTIDGCESEPFAVTVDVLLGNEHFAAGNFAYYPNPVKDVLTLSYTEAITHVEVFNMLGQKVLEAAPGQDLARVDLSSLANAAYTVKISVGEASKTIRVIKQ